MTHHINLIAGNKHRQLARQVGLVVEIISTGLMAPINFSAITFIPGVEFTFGSLSFVAGVNAKPRVSNLEATRIGRPILDPADRIVIQPASELDSDRFKDECTLPRYPFSFRNSANTFQRMLSQIMEVQAEHSADMGKLGRMVGANCLTYDECWAINVIIKPLELPDHGDESLHRVLNSPTNFESSIGSWNPARRLYAIMGGGEAPAEVDLEAQQGDAVHQEAAEAERLRRKEEDHRALAAKGRHV